MAFFHDHVLPHEQVNKMNARNLAIVFAPVTLWASGLSPMEELTNAGKVNSVVATIVDHWPALSSMVTRSE